MSNFNERMKRTAQSQRCREVCVAFVLLAVAGCGASPPPTSDPPRARQALESALDAWKNGETAEAMRNRTPAVYFYDPQQEAGAQLVEYQIESEHASGHSWVCEVVLTLKNAQGQSFQRRGGYYVDTDPAIAIVRQT